MLQREARLAVLQRHPEFRWYRSSAYVCTFLSYAALHLTRKSYANVKCKLEHEAMFDSTFLSVMDAVFMLCYAAGSFFSGSVGSVISGPSIVVTGLLGSAACIFILACFVWADVESLQNNDFLRTVAPLGLWMIHGLMQSTGAPANTAIMSNWFGSRNRGYVFGTWTCHQYVGNIAAGLAASAILAESRIHWTVALVVPVLCSVCCACIVGKFLPERPENVPCLDAFVQRHLRVDDDISQGRLRGDHISLRDALRVPNVLGYSLAFGLFKFVGYALFFWLPFYLSRFYSPARSNLIAVLYDVGTIPGSILVGVISDIYGGRRACVIATFTVSLVPLLWAFAHPDFLLTVPAPFVLMLLSVMGCLVGGPTNIITSAVAVDIADNYNINGPNDLMTVTGLINGSGSVIAALGLATIGPLQARYGWKLIWHILITCTFLGTLLLSPIIRKEMQREGSVEAETATTDVPQSSRGEEEIGELTGERLSLLDQRGRASGDAYHRFPLVSSSEHEWYGPGVSRVRE